MANSDKRIVYTGDEDYLVLVIPSDNCGLTVEQIQTKDVPSGKTSYIINTSASGAQGHQGRQGSPGSGGAQGHLGVQGATGPTETIRIARAWCGFDGSGSGNINTDYNISSISEPASHKWKLTFSTSWAGGSNNEKGYCAVNATGAESNHWVTHRYRDYVQIEAGGAHAHQQSVVIFDD